MGFQVQNILDQTRPLGAEIQPANTPIEQPQTNFQVGELGGEQATHVSLLEQAQQIGQSVIDTFRDLLFTQTSQDQAKEVGTNPTQETKAELSRLAGNYTSNPQETEKFQGAINELFDTFSDERTARNAANNAGLLDKIESLGIKKETAIDLFKTVQAWEQFSDSQRIASAGAIGVNVLENLGVLSNEDAINYNDAVKTIALISNSNVSDKNKALSIANTIAELSTLSYSGSVREPTVISGIPVIASAPTEDGSAGFLLADGTVVPATEIQSTQDVRNVTSALQAISILTSDAETKDKISALAGVGLQAAYANDLIDKVDAGRFGAALSVFNTVTNWDEMNNSQRLTAAIQTADSVVGALSGSATQTASTTAGTNLGSALLSGVGAIAGIFQGVQGAKDTYEATSELPRSQAVKAGALGGAVSGAAIGAGVATLSGMAAGATFGATIGSSVPVVGTIIGLVIGAAVGGLMGAFGSGKSSAQKGRDAWRDAMEQGGFAHKIDGSHHVTLADGTEYNIGKDGGHKLKNVDGTERLTVDIDQSNPLAGNSIDVAHLFAIATGLNPTDHSKSWMFHGAVAQSLNAATSNAKTQRDVLDNYRAFLTKGGINAENIALKLEVLRVSNKITDHGYKVFLNGANKVFGTNIQPIDRETAHKAIVEKLATAPQLTAGELELLATLTDPVKYNESLRQLNENLEREKRRMAAD